MFVLNEIILYDSSLSLSLPYPFIHSYTWTPMEDGHRQTWQTHLMKTTEMNIELVFCRCRLMWTSGLISTPNQTCWLSIILLPCVIDDAHRVALTGLCVYVCVCVTSNDPSQMTTFSFTCIHIVNTLWLEGTDLEWEQPYQSLVSKQRDNEWWMDRHDHPITKVANDGNHSCHVLRHYMFNNNNNTNNTKSNHGTIKRT